MDSCIIPALQPKLFFFFGFGSSFHARQKICFRISCTVWIRIGALHVVFFVSRRVISLLGAARFSVVHNNTYNAGSGCSAHARLTGQAQVTGTKLAPLDQRFKQPKDA